MGLEEITVSQDIDLINDHNEEWVDDRSKPEVELDDEQQQSFEQDLANLRVLEWLNEMTSWKHEIQENRTRGSLLGCPGRATTHSGFQPQLDIRYAIDGDVDGYFCPGSGGRTYPH